MENHAMKEIWCKHGLFGLEYIHFTFQKLRWGINIILTGEPKLCPISCKNDNFETISGTTVPWWEKVTKPVLRLMPSSDGLEVISSIYLAETSSSRLFKVLKSVFMSLNIVSGTANFVQTPP